jgi:phosphoserine phosphatase
MDDRPGGYVDDDGATPRRPAACLDLDGTVYPSGSVFVKCLVLYPWYGEVGAADAARLRRCVGLVAGYRYGESGRRRVEAALAWLHALRERLPRAVSLRLADALLDATFADLPGRLARLAGTGRRGSERWRGAEGTYAGMRDAVLSSYASFLEGRRVDAVERTTRAVVDRHAAVDPAWRRLLERLRAAGATVYLVTDAPEHVGRAYLSKAGGDAERVRATTFETCENRFTGAFEPVEKAAAARRARTAGEHDFLVAAGDSAVDVGMRDAADVFVAVVGEGDVDRALEDLADGVVVDADAPTGAHDRLDGRAVLRASGGTAAAAAVARAFEAAGVLS